MAADASPPELPKPTAVPIGEGEEILELGDDERAAIPSRSDDQA